MTAHEPEQWDVEGLVDHVVQIHRTMQDVRFCFILGAGASVTSGIPAAGRLVARWLDELHRRHGRGKTLQQWAETLTEDIRGFTLANATSFYSQVFARRFRHFPEQAYADLEDIMQGKEPSFGYSVLAYILAETRHKLVITTNFDNLVADALSIYTATSPLVCGHESLASFIRVVPRRPVVVKIHRDLLMGPMNRADEIGALSEAWREPLTRVFSTYTPIVIGYGGNDGSLMGFLRSLPAGAIPGGMFWTYWGPGGPPGPEVRGLVAQHGGVLVPIDGFDELMLMLNMRLGIPVLDEALERKSRARLDNYRRAKDELLARVFPPPPPREDVAAPPPPPAEPEADDEEERAGELAPPVFSVSPSESTAPPAPSDSHESLPPTDSSTARRVPAVHLERLVAAPAPDRPAPPPPTRGLAGPDLPTLSSRSDAPRAARPAPGAAPGDLSPGTAPTSTRSAEPAPSDKATSASVRVGEADLLRGAGLDLGAVTDDAPASEATVHELARALATPQGARATLQRAMLQLAQGDTDASPFSALMRAHAEQDYDRSFALFRDALKRYPDDRGLQIGFAERLSEVPDPSSIREAIATLEAAVQRAPTDVRALRHLALLRAWAADFKGATAELRRAWALAVDPPLEQDLALNAFVAGLFARRGSRSDARFLAILKAAVRGGVPELTLPRNLVAGLIKNLDNPGRRLYAALDRMLAGELPLARVEAAEPRFGELAPADLAALGPGDAP